MRHWPFLSAPPYRSDSIRLMTNLDAAPSKMNDATKLVISLNKIDRSASKDGDEMDKISTSPIPSVAFPVNQVGAHTTTADVSKGEQQLHNPDVKSPRGWPSRRPFFTTASLEAAREYQETVYWGELTWKQKLAWRRGFLKEYLSETKLCLPYVKRLFVTIYRISPWRTIAMFALNILRGLLPAVSLQVKGGFIQMVFQVSQRTHY